MDKLIYDLSYQTLAMNIEGVTEYARRYKKYNRLTIKDIHDAFNMSEGLYNE